MTTRPRIHDGPGFAQWNFGLAKASSFDSLCGIEPGETVSVPPGQLTSITCAQVAGQAGIHLQGELHGRAKSKK